MADPKKPTKPGASKLWGGILWGGAQVGVEWFVYPAHLPGSTLGSVISAAAGGFVAGWITVGLLNLLARMGLGGKALLVAGLLVGVATASGAVQGLSQAIKSFTLGFGSVNINLEELKEFLGSWRIAPAAALGALSGLYVRGKVPQKKKA